MWYYVLDGEEHGPVSEDEVHDLVVVRVPGSFDAPGRAC
jgi:hypothetical protein